MDQPTILIVADEVEFPRSVTGRWQAERTVPSFTMMSSDLCQDLDSASFDLAIVGGVMTQSLPQVLRNIEETHKPVLLVDSNGGIARDRSGKFICLRQHDGWLEVLVSLSSEILQRTEAMGRVQSLERLNVVLEKQATLGRYVLEMRHTLNNALTSVLGNSELMLIEPGTLSAGPRSQVETIRNMALRIHEIMQRFSSLEKEFSVVERQAGQDNLRRMQAAVS